MAATPTTHTITAVATQICDKHGAPVPTIYLGSTAPARIEAVRAACKTVFPGLEVNVVPTDTETGMMDRLTPFSVWDEATNRMDALRRRAVLRTQHDYMIVFASGLWADDPETAEFGDEGTACVVEHDGITRSEYSAEHMYPWFIVRNGKARGVPASEIDYAVREWFKLKAPSPTVAMFRIPTLTDICTEALTKARAH